MKGNGPAPPLDKCGRPAARHLADVLRATSTARRASRGRSGSAWRCPPAASPMGPTGGRGPPALGRRPGRAGFPVRALCGPPDPKLHDIKSISDSISDQARTDLISHDIGSIWTDLIPCKIRSSRNDLISNLISDQAVLDQILDKI